MAVSSIIINRVQIFGDAIEMQTTINCEDLPPYQEIYKFRRAQDLTPAALKEFFLAKTDHINKILNKAEIIKTNKGINIIDESKPADKDKKYAVIDQVIVNQTNVTIKVNFNDTTNGVHINKIWSYDNEEDLNLDNIKTTIKAEMSRIFGLHDITKNIEKSVGMNILDWAKTTSSPTKHPGN